MIAALMAAWLVAAPVGRATAPDTTVALRRGDRVVVESFSGEIGVQAWDRGTLSIATDDAGSPGVGVSRSGGVVTVRPDDRKSRRRGVEMVLRVPPWIDLRIEGREVDVRVRGVEGEIDVRNISGDVSVEGPARRMTLSTMEGEIVVRGARGPVKAHSRSDDVSLYDVRGDVDIGSGDGDLRLDGVDASSIRAETLDGDVFFDGTLAAGGTYSFSVHDGDATLVLPRNADAQVSVSTFDGEFTSEFPVVLQGYQGDGKFDFTLGKGSAHIEVKVFDGEIRIQQRRGR